MLKGFYHTGFVVRDIESSIKFYTDLMGLTLEWRWDRTGDYIENLLQIKGARVKGAFLNMGPGHSLELVQYVTPQSDEHQSSRTDLGASHLGFFVENIHEYYETMSAKGLRFLGPPSSLVQDGKVVRMGVYAQDLDGNWLEFTEIPQ